MKGLSLPYYVKNGKKNHDQYKCNEISTFLQLHYKRKTAGYSQKQTGWFVGRDRTLTLEERA